MYDYFRKFSQASGLTINKKKSSVFFGGVTDEVQQEILRVLEFLKGELPVKYLGVLLSTKRLSISQCQPLWEKMVGKITSWTSKLLSYAGRRQLIKSNLFFMQTFWCQVFVLPKNILHLIEAVCRKFLWTEGIELNKKALVSWEKVCFPKSARGFNVIDIYTWNKAAICKHLWNLM